jgi:hypothetical protein
MELMERQVLKVFKGSRGQLVQLEQMAQTVLMVILELQDQPALLVLMAQTVLTEQQVRRAFKV